MAVLPASSEFTGGSVTEGQFKAALTGQRDFLAGLLGITGTPATALAALGALAGAYVEKTAAYTVTTADRGRLINATTGSWTLALPAAATAGAGFSLYVMNTGAGTITVDPSGAELIDGVATRTIVAERSRLIICTGTAWVSIATGRAMDTLTDATANRFLVTGGFGLGGMTPLLTNINVTDSSIASGLYCYDTSLGSSGGPPNVTRGNLIHLRRAAGGGETQMLVSESGIGSPAIPGLLFTRSRVTTTWTAWRRVLDDQGLLGTVSQTAGLPTGAVLESGTNANGRYERRADGVQECWVSMAASAAGAASWTFPAAFIEEPRVNGNAIATVASTVVLDAAPSTTAATFSTRDKTDARRADTVHLHAIGRWSTMT